MVLDPALKVARRGALAYVGALALTRDTVVDTVEKFAEHGAPVERAVRTRLNEATAAARRRFEQATSRLRRPAKPDTTPTSPADLLVTGRDRLLDALNIPTQRALHELNDQLDILGAAIEELRTQRRLPKPAELPEPLPGYDMQRVDVVIHLRRKPPVCIAEIGDRAREFCQNDHIAPDWKRPMSGPVVNPTNGAGVNSSR